MRVEPQRVTGIMMGIKQRILAGALLTLLAGGCYFSGSGEGYAGTQPRPAATTPAPVATAPTVTPGATLVPATTKPIRIQFDRGAWGDVITGTISSRYLLWAKAGQVFTTTLTSQHTATASLYVPSGTPLYEQMSAGNTARATLPNSGDYMLEIRSSGQFTVEVEIR